jgi:acyl-CoA thioesterase I
MTNMNSFELSFADGTSFFAGVAATFLAVLLLLRFRTGDAAVVLGSVALAAMAVVVFSATPLPVWAYVIWLGTGMTTLFLCRRRPTHKARIVSAGVFIAASIGLCAVEIPYHMMPRFVLRPGRTVYIVGDSLSAGLGVGERCWPAVLDDLTQLTVINLAKPGATTCSAMAQAKLAKDVNAAIILEIGGNDFISGVDAETFRQQLDALVCSLQKHRPILMFELPLWPFRNSFGRVQRDIAAKYGVILIPKRCLAAVLGLHGDTRDGLHLSQSGHDLLAHKVAGILQPAHDD